jgi:hypothetical protein
MALFALFTLGYLVGVWTACIVFRQPQRAYEQAGSTTSLGVPVIVRPTAFHTEVTGL